MKKALIIFMAGLLVSISSPSKAEEGSEHGQHKRGCGEFCQGMKEKAKAHQEQQKEENQQFRSTLKDMDPQARSAAVIKHRQEQFEKNKSFRDGMYQERRSHLEEMLNKNEKLSAAQKEKILNFNQEQHEKRISFQQSLYDENMSFMQSLANQKDLTKEQRKEQMKSHRESQKQKLEEFRKAQEQARKAFREQLRSEVKAEHTQDK